ncbi:dihydroorotase [Hydrogenibacillus schlegelii]|uniref:Dihydroorotase n=1 Tax=Hydrogenibacillus schlegelii TaxID=1484 RepID=A0A132MGY0_HYDSH|nr:dihydroorotase [Hydrogenibacillus schlegelii]KWW97110.1 hypothetical protein TR75_10245 [Hydrogenibacillus schlegelii]OAR03864.1 hypothetical protein SA87_03240 [Hydrogenibacillus schlegelii]PTQ54754.1 MAG: Dihydroorotase [Hydrogenibacillus schlegelii]
MRRWIANGRLFTPDGKEAVGHLAVEGGWIADVRFGPPPPPAEVALDAEGLWLFPAFVDVHVHFREPGQTHKETIETGSRAAARGGFATVVMMPNTDPPLDRPERFRAALRQAARTARVRVYGTAAITLDQRGETLVDMAALARLGAVGFTDDGRGIARSDVMRAAFRLARAVDRPILMHSEDAALSAGGVFRPEAPPIRRGVRPWPKEAEAAPLFRDVLLAAEAKARYHVQHVSTALSLEAIALGRRLGADVSAEVTPHHLILTAEDIPDVDPDTPEGRRRLGPYKMNPPLAPAADVDALRRALADGTIDLVATDHAPHAEDEKARPIDRSPFGIVGLETAFPLLFTALVRTGHLTLRRLVEAMSVRPAARFRLPGGRIAPGAPADVVLVDLETPRPVDPTTFFSKGKNTPFAGRVLYGWPVATFVAGRVIYADPDRVPPSALRRFGGR